MQRRVLQTDIVAGGIPASERFALEEAGVHSETVAQAEKAAETDSAGDVELF